MKLYVTRSKCICKKCGKIFYILPYRIACGRGKHCSKECYWSRGKYETRQCGICKKDITKPISTWRVKDKNNKRGYFCSMKCSGVWTSKNVRGKKTNSWRGGVVGKNKLDRINVAYKKWRKAVFERDDYTCQICGKRGGELNADHIRSFADYPSLRYDIFNGQTMCRSCHYYKTTGEFMSENNKWGLWY
ncbi:HNH endonuclease [Candidatus Dojkabacteria bacterium]|jgi:5-methylcytosine-specific restriction endonuclease McrA|nr:HNH endonuclease [Candidatus Dojkabacteria bacterium]